MVTKAQQSALDWLKERGGDAVRQGRGRAQVLCCGEIAPFFWTTFKGLIAAGLVEQAPNWRIKVKA